jgi:hypothetical protein
MQANGTVTGMDMAEVKDAMEALKKICSEVSSRWANRENWVLPVGHCIPIQLGSAGACEHTQDYVIVDFEGNIIDTGTARLSHLDDAPEPPERALFRVSEVRRTIF